MGVIGIVLRGYREADLDNIFRLDELCFESEFRFDLRTIKRFAEAKHTITVVAEVEGGEIAGFIIVEVTASRQALRGYVVTLDVGPAWRRAGLGGRLMNAVEQKTIAAGAGRIELHVFVGNEGAVQFYQSRGYERVGMRRGFYGTGVDGMVLDGEIYCKEFGAIATRPQ